MSVGDKSVSRFFKEVFDAWSDVKSPRLGAALAFYTIFAIAPLVLLTISVAGMWFGPERARDELFNQLNGLVGSEGGRAIQSLVAAANQPKVGLWATIGALGTLVAGATGVFVELQDALNTIWGVQRKTGQGLRYLIKDRLLSFGMVLAIGFLLLVSLILDAGLSALGAFASSFAPAAHIIWTGINFAASLFVITMLFAVIYKGLPDVDIAWRDVWMGAFVTAILFNVGKFLIGYYLGRSSMVSIYGAAGSFIVLLMWIYYSSQIFFFGAEFTRVYAETTGSKQ
ncbi:MAG TPA: YihY/virulence factor BrkB family protein [Verrucomicrobiae bacterium]|jgi:membrane protein